MWNKNQKLNIKNDLNDPIQCSQSPKLDKENQTLNPIQQNQLQEQDIKNLNQEQEQEQEDKNKEQILLKIIEKFQRLIDQFIKNKKQNTPVVLLVGVTGSGKSTVFNFQSGADFFIKQNKLEIKNPSNNFSIMDDGMSSITKEPNFYHDQKYNHLIIDFPGFQDTNGEQDQLLFELLFHKIVGSDPIKVIYVIKNFDNNLPNRGSDLLEFVNQICKKGNINIKKFNLLLNCYMEDLSDELLQDKIKADLRSVNMLQSIDKILVLRKAKNNHLLSQIFNDQQRQNIWKHIEQMQSTKFQPQQLPKSQIISDYLRSRILKTIKKYGFVLSQYFDNSLNKLNKSQIEATIPQMRKLVDLVNKIDNQSSLEWYTNYIQTCEQLVKDLSIQDDIVIRSNNFIQIYKYYSQFSNLIQGYDDLKILKIIVNDQLKSMNNFLTCQLEILKHKQHFDSQISQFEKDKQQFNSKMKDQDKKIENYQQQISLLEASKDVHSQKIKDLNSKLQESMNVRSSLQDEIQKQQKTFNFMRENFQEKIDEMVNQIKILQNRKPQVYHHYHNTTEYLCQIF